MGWQESIALHESGNGTRTAVMLIRAHVMQTFKSFRKTTFVWSCWFSDHPHKGCKQPFKLIGHKKLLLRARCRLRFRANLTAL